MSSMVIVCEGCGARFRMNFALFQDANGARILCRKCGRHIEVRHPEASPAPPTPVSPIEIPFPHAPSSDAPDEQAILPVSASIDAEPEPEPVDDGEPESVAEAASGPAAEAYVPAEAEAPAEAPWNVPAVLPGDTSPEEEPPHAQPAPWSEIVPPPDAPDTAPAREPEAATIHPGHLEMSDPLPEEPFFPPAVADPAPEPDTSREERAAEIASLKRRLRASSRRRPSTLTIFLLVVPGILLLAGGAYFFRDTKPAQELLRKFFPPSGSGNTGHGVSTKDAVEKPAYEIRDMTSSYAKTFIGGNLFVIRGAVANVGKGPSRGIRVQATLLGKDNLALVNSTVFAANLVDNTTLRHANRAVIEGLLGFRYGERNVNRDIPKGKSLLFMVVFFDPPGQVESFTVKALDAE